MTFNAQSTVGDLLANPASREVMERHMPGVSTHPMIGMASAFSLEKLATFPQANLDADKLQVLVDELAVLG